MSRKRKTLLIVILIVLLGWNLISRYNRLVSMEENVDAAWSQVENVYQRRMDLIPNLVETVKGYAKHEKETFTAVTEARAKAGSMNLKGIINDPQAFQRFEQAQTALSSALSRLMVVVERYPDLKANQNFLDLQAQLEGTENRIAVERRRYNLAAQEYNTRIRRFPDNLLAALFGFKRKAYFKAQAGAATAPKVKF